VTAWRPPPPSALETGAVHVWRIRPARHDTSTAWAVLSDAERERAGRFIFEEHRKFFVATHAIVRRILATYIGLPADALQFAESEAGKPSLLRGQSETHVEFNLSHSGDLALLAVSAAARVGVDVERWHRHTEHLELAEHFFSAHERDALRALAAHDADLVAGFFAAWSRKEAYLKATGTGITQGLDHFSVSLRPGEPARLITDERDAMASERWYFAALDAGPEYSAALVAEQPVSQVLLLDYR